MNLLIKCFVLSFALTTLSAEAQSTQSCDQLYSQRGRVVLAASDCYHALALQAATPASSLELYNLSFISLSALVSDGAKTADERTAIDAGLKLSLELSQKIAGSAEALYWSAVFTSFDVIAKDRGSPVPVHTFASLKSVQQNLRQALQLKASLHFYGPGRVLGIMNTKMPALVGGDKVLAENLLRSSFQQAPELSANHVAYARILIINGKDSDARNVLSAFLNRSDDQLNPYPGQPLRALTEEIARDRAEAKTMLADLNDA